MFLQRWTSAITNINPTVPPPAHMSGRVGYGINYWPGPPVERSRIWKPKLRFSNGLHNHGFWMQNNSAYLPRARGPVYFARPPYQQSSQAYGGGTRAIPAIYVPTSLANDMNGRSSTV